MNYLYTFIFFLFTIVTVAQQERGFKRNDNQSSSFNSYGSSSKDLKYDAKYAILIGVNNYKDDRIDDLRYSTSDAISIAELLTNELGYDPKNVIVLLDENATRKNIVDTMSYFIRDESISKNSQLLFYYAGHGSTVKNARDMSSLSGFLLTHDSVYGSEYSTSINMDEIRLLAEKSQPKHMLYLIDVCYGGLAKSRSMSNAFIQNVWDMNSREIITAGTGDETVIESEEWGHSVFTKVFLDAFKNGLGDSNDDNIISTAELYGYIQQRVPYYAKNKGGKQTPQYSFLTPDNGTFLFELSNGALMQTSTSSTIPTDGEAIADKFKSKLVINSNVDNARVFINGIENRFISNKLGEYLLTPGFYKVELKRDKFSSTPKEVLVKPDTTTSVDFTLESAFTNVEFKVSPPDAAVLIDNELIGTGSFKTDISKGRHTLVVEKAGFKPITNVLNLTMNETAFAFTLEEIIAKIELKTIPSGATIINGRDTLGITPMMVSLPYGKHSVIFVKKNHQTKLLDVNISESALLRYDVVMQLEPEFLAGQQANKIRLKSLGGFVVNGGLAYAGYYGYNHLDGLTKEIKENEENGVEDDRDGDLYNVGKYASASLGAIFAITSVVKLVKAVTVSKKKILRNNYGQNVSFDYRPGIGRNASVLSMRIGLK